MRNRMDNTLKIAVNAVEPAGKASFVHSCIQTRLKVDTMENDPFASFICQVGESKIKRKARENAG